MAGRRGRVGRRPNTATLESQPFAQRMSIHDLNSNVHSNEINQISNGVNSIRAKHD